MNSLVTSHDDTIARHSGGLVEGTTKKLFWMTNHGGRIPEEKYQRVPIVYMFFYELDMQKIQFHIFIISRRFYSATSKNQSDGHFSSTRLLLNIASITCRAAPETINQLSFWSSSRRQPMNYHQLAWKPLWREWLAVKPTSTTKAAPTLCTA